MIVDCRNVTRRFNCNCNPFHPALFSCVGQPWAVGPTAGGLLAQHPQPRRHVVRGQLVPALRAELIG
jgi:hypothetical protein